jgi:hypothetical protein
MASRHSAKWNELYFLKYDADKVIDDSAQTYSAFFHHISAEHKLTNGDRGNGYTSVEDRAFALRPMTIADKLFIISHGGANGVIGEDKSPDTLVRDLKNWGLKNVGLVTFKCCHLGRGSFLEMFVSACSQRGVTVGWVKGYTGLSRTTYGITGEPWELVLGDHKIPKFGDARFRIVKGNHPTPLEKFERYSYQSASA